MNNFQLSIQSPLAYIYIDEQLSDTNNISASFIYELDKLVEEVLNNDSVKAIVLTSQKKDFISGTNAVHLFQTIEAEEWMAVMRKTQKLFSKIEHSPKPFIAAIKGRVYGTGLELVLACQYRIASDDIKNRFAFPQVHSGLMPCSGATQRLPELCGLEKALNILLRGKILNVHQALKLGLIDKIVPAYQLMTKAERYAKAMIGKKIIRENKLELSDKVIEKTPRGKNYIMEKTMQKIYAKTKGNLPAPLKIMESLEIGLAYGRGAGLEAELAKYQELLLHPVSKNRTLLQNIIQKKAVNPMAKLANPLKKIAIIGAGLPATHLAYLCLARGYTVLLFDKKEERLQYAQAFIWHQLKKSNKQHLIGKFELIKVFNRLQTVSEYDVLFHADMIIDCQSQNQKEAQYLLKTIEPVMKKTAAYIFFQANDLIKNHKANQKQGKRIAGLQFTFPLLKNNYVEIIPERNAKADVKATLFDFVLQLQKTPVEVKDEPGFYAKRLLVLYLNEALMMIGEGCRIEEVEGIALDIGYAKPPFQLMDELGFEEVAKLFDWMQPFFQQRGNKGFSLSPTLRNLYKKGFGGQQNKKGFYLYKDKKGKDIKKKKKRPVNPEVYDFFGQAEIFQHPKPDAKTLRQRLLLIVTNESAKCFEEDIFGTVEDGDIGAVLGLGYPKHTGGPFRYIDSIGADEIIKRLNTLTKKTIGGQRFSPAAILEIYGRKGRMFY